jgi:hypothetical protein
VACPTIAASIAPTFFFGSSLTLLPLARADLSLRQALGLAFASDTLSIAMMEFVDSFIVPALPGATDAGPTDVLFWGPLAEALLTAFWAAFPVNRWLIARQGPRGRARLSLSTARDLGAYDVVVLVLLALIAFALAVGLLRRFASKRVSLRSCCSARPWPPDDLTGHRPEPRA